MMMHQHAMRRNLWLLKAHAFLLNISPVIPVIVIYYRDRMGLDYQQFMISQAVFSIVVILMEVPTGWLSDVWTRRKVMMLGTFVQVIGWLIVWQSRHFISAIAGEGVIGISIGLLSGTNSAILYESLLDLERDSEFPRREGLRHGLGLYACGASALLSGFLYVWNIDLPVLLTALTSLFALIFAFLLKDPHRHQESVRQHPIKDIRDTLHYALTGHGDVAAIIFFSAVLFATTKMMFWSQQPYFTRVGIPVAWFGVLTAIGMLLGGVGGQFSYRLAFAAKGDRNVAILTLCLLLACVVCVIDAAFPVMAAPLLLISGSMIFGLGFPRVQDALSSRAPPNRRATVLSTASLVTHLFSVPLLIFVGWVTEDFGVRCSLVALTLLSGSAAVAIARLNKKSIQRKAILRSLQ